MEINTRANHSLLMIMVNKNLECYLGLKKAQMNLAVAGSGQFDQQSFFVRVSNFEMLLGL